MSEDWTLTEIVESVAREHSPHLWDGRFRGTLASILNLTDEQVAKSVAEKQVEKLQEAEEYLLAFYPLLEKQIREQIAQNLETHVKMYDNGHIGFLVVRDAYANAARIALGRSR